VTGTDPYIHVYWMKSLAWSVLSVPNSRHVTGSDMWCFTQVYERINEFLAMKFSCSTSSRIGGQAERVL
jgi:hypothetical protein